MSSDNSNWFKPVEIKDMPSKDDFMNFEGDLEDAVHCDEVENEEFLFQETENAEQETEHDVIEEEEELNDDRDVIEESEEENEPEHDITSPELVEDHDVIAEENKTDCDVIEESDEDSVVALFTVPYESSDFLSDEKIPPDYPAEIPPLLNEENENVNFDWKGILSDLKTYCTFSALKQYISRYHEVRACITFEAVLKENSFLMHDILARGDLEGSENRPAVYASYSGLLIPEITRLNEQSIRTVYHRDVIANARDFTFMGMWQLHHAAEVFRCPIVSAYPQHTNKEIWKDINRVVLPINPMQDIK